MAVRLSIVILAALCALGVRGSADFDGPAPTRPVAVVAAAAIPASHAPVVIPAHLTTVNPVIWGKPCVYTPAVLPAYVSAAAYNATAPLTTCTDKRLTQAQVNTCLTCLSITTRHTCLTQTALVSHGADKESCTWVGHRWGQLRAEGSTTAEKVVRYSIGVDSPSSQSYTFAPSTCQLDVEFEVDKPLTLSAYPTAQFNVWLNGFNNGTELPGGLQSGGICVLARGKPRCSLSITVHKRASFMSFYRLIWTDRLPIVQALRKSNSSCADTPDGICSSYGPPYNFDYQLTIKEHACRRGGFAPSSGNVVFGQPGNIVRPGGQAYRILRGDLLAMDGASAVRWKVSSPHPMIVAAAPASVVNSMCEDDVATASRTCNFSGLRAAALPGSYCLGRRCAAHFKFNPGLRGWYMAIIYATPYTFYPANPWYYNATAWPTQLVNVEHFDVWL